MRLQRTFQEHTDEVKLLIPQAKIEGGYVTEYIPKNYSPLSDWLRWRYVFIRRNLGWKIYYWQIRHWFRPLQRKIYDLNFMLHYQNEHGEPPKDRLERWHHWLAMQHYGLELHTLQARDSLLWQKKHSPDIHLQSDAYIHAYNKKWISNFKEGPEWKVLYHGIELFELLPIFDKIQSMQKHRLRVLKRAIKKQNNQT